MKLKLQVESCTLPVPRNCRREAACSLQSSTFTLRRAFTLVEVMVVVALLALIVVALMAVFSNTQKAFRASITQSDIMESGRATMELMASDVRGLVACNGASNNVSGVNFFVTNNSVSYQPLMQPLVGSAAGASRTNLLQWFFILGRQNMNWTGVGYIVNSGSPNPLYPLYRFSAQTNVVNSPLTLFTLFTNEINASAFTSAKNMSHLMDGVVGLTVRAYDPNGFRLTNNPDYYDGTNFPNQNINFYLPPYQGETSFAMFSNALPATVQIEMATLEDRTLQRADSLTTGQPPSSNPSSAQWQYLQAAAGNVHVFRQRVSIPRVDMSAYPYISQ